MLTYEELRDSIEKWSENNDPDFLAQIDTLIRQTENRIVTAVRLPSFSATMPVMALQETATTATPADFLAPDELWITGYPPMLKKDTSFIREAYRFGTGFPRFYAMQDNATFLWGPTPDANYAVNVKYFNQPASVCDNHDGTYVSNNFSAALLSGSLWLAAVFMKSWDAAQLHQQMFMQALGSSAKFTTGPFSKQTAEKASSAVDGSNQLAG